MDTVATTATGKAPEQLNPSQFSRNAFSRALMSNFFILRNASVTRAMAFLSLDFIMSSMTLGTTCHETPNLSLQPAALFRHEMGGELAPVVVDLLLGLAVHHERDRFVEGEGVGMGAVHGGELPPFEREGGVFDRALPVGLLPFGVAEDVPHPGVVEDRRVEVDGFLGLPAGVPDEHEGGRDLLPDRPVPHEHDLPRQPVPVLQPAVPFTE